MQAMQQRVVRPAQRVTSMRATAPVRRPVVRVAASATAAAGRIFNFSAGPAMLPLDVSLLWLNFLCRPYFSLTPYRWLRRCWRRHRLT